LQALWKCYREWLDREYPEAILIAEWGNPRSSINAGFDIDFMIHFGEPAYNALVGTWGRKFEGSPVFFDRAGGGDIMRFLDNYLLNYSATVGRGYISLPTGNHDFPRHNRGRDKRELQAIYAMLFTLPGTPFIYYGDEIGMRYLENLTAKEGSYGSRTGARTPMQWRRGRNAGFSTAAASKLYLPVDPSPCAPTVEDQETDPSSLLNLTRKLLALRKQYPALGNTGAFKPIFAEKNKYPFVYERSQGSERFWIAINPTDQDLKTKLPATKSVEAIHCTGAELTTDSKKSVLSMGPVSFGIFRVE